MLISADLGENNFRETGNCHIRNQNRIGRKAERNKVLGLSFISKPGSQNCNVLQAQK